MFTGNLDPGTLQQFNDAERRAGHIALRTHAQSTHALHMEPVHIFLRGNCLDDRLLVDVLRKRELYQDTVHLVIRIELFYQFYQFLLGCLLRQLIRQRFDPDIGTRFLLIIDIDTGSGIISHLDHCQRHIFSLLFELCHLFLQFILDLL